VACTTILQTCDCSRAQRHSGTESPRPRSWPPPACDKRVRRLSEKPPALRDGRKPSKHPLRRTVERAGFPPQSSAERGVFVADPVAWMRAACVETVRRFCELLLAHRLCRAAFLGGPGHRNALA